jgi:NAD(P)H-hydrate repair Nnr-like enzyme with NAD(P)H-hydrate epimerase domain
LIAFFEWFHCNSYIAKQKKEAKPKGKRQMENSRHGKLKKDGDVKRENKPLRFKTFLLIDCLLGMHSQQKTEKEQAIVFLTLFSV